MPATQTLFGCITRLLLWPLALVGLLVVVATLTPLDAWWAKHLAGGWNDPPGEVLIVLGGSRPSSDGVIAWDSYVRSLYAVRAYRERAFPLVVLSGGTGLPPVAASMRDFVQSQGVPAAVLRVEERSRSTRENAQYVAEMLKAAPGRKVLLTSDYHMYRALRAFRKAGLDVAPHPVPDAFKRSGTLGGRWPAFLDLAGESVKIVYYWIRGWI
ncbi:MAG: YdcF family protein [Terriglobales bacterium]